MSLAGRMDVATLSLTLSLWILPPFSIPAAVACRWTCAALAGIGPLSQLPAAACQVL